MTMNKPLPLELDSDLIINIFQNGINRFSLPSRLSLFIMLKYSQSKLSRYCQQSIRI
uniref:Uncharacterized protein n=1 Tax=Tetranychus urticae TaxID=32264 RepID=T1K768_TETUR